MFFSSSIQVKGVILISKVSYRLSSVSLPECIVGNWQNYLRYTAGVFLIAVSGYQENTSIRSLDPKTSIRHFINGQELAAGSCPSHSRSTLYFTCFEARGA